MNKIFIFTFTLILILVGCSQKLIPPSLTSQEEGKLSVKVFKDNKPLPNEFTANIDPFLDKKVHRVEVRQFDNLTEEDKKYFTDLLEINKLPIYAVFDEKGVVFKSNDHKEVIDFLQTGFDSRGRDQRPSPAFCGSLVDYDFL